MRTFDRRTLAFLGSFAISRLVTFGVALILAASSELAIGGVLSRWDGGWYLSIVRHGYPNFVPTGTGVTGQSSIAFFPGYPLLVRAVSFGYPVVAGVAISTAAGLLLAVVLGRLAERLGAGGDAPLRVVLLFSFLPAAFVLSMVYADALFLLLVALTFLLLHDERWELAGMAAAGAGFVRPTGIVLAGACLAAALVAVRRHRSWRALIAPALAPLGAAAYLLYLRLHTGDWFAFFRVEDRGWGERLDLGVSNARAIWRHMSQLRVTFFVAVLAIVVLAAGIGLWLLIRWRPPAYITVYVAGIVALAALSSKPTSSPRLLLSAFPMLIPAVERLSRRQYAIVLAASAALMVALFTVTTLSDTLSP